MISKESSRKGNRNRIISIVVFALTVLWSSGTIFVTMMHHRYLVDMMWHNSGIMTMIMLSMGQEEEDDIPDQDVLRLIDALSQQNENLKLPLPPLAAGGPFNNVYLYVIEVANSTRQGKVAQQARFYDATVQTVPAWTPPPMRTESFNSSSSSFLNPHDLQRMEQWCQEEAVKDEKLPKAQRKPPNQAPYKINTHKMACTLSHLQAVLTACVAFTARSFGSSNLKSKQKEQSTLEKPAIALILEDDANLEPVPLWPASLRDMLSELPSENWTIASVACTNEVNVDAFTQQHYFRPHTGIHDFGAVAVAYNLDNVCPTLIQSLLALQRAKQDSASSGLSSTTLPSVWDLYLNSTHPCQPADMLIYDKFQGTLGAQTMHMPLFYFSESPDKADPGALNTHFPTLARKQRRAWDKFRTMTSRKPA